jgi:broad specificity phosphatase PhoE
MLDLLLTRHGNVAANEVVLGGQLDLPLTEKGRSEAEALARRLEGIRVDRIVSSPMARALETAQAVAKGRPIEVDERLRELDYGQWEGLTHAEIDARDPVLWARWERDPAATHAPGGECGDDVARRVTAFLAELLAAELGGDSPAGAYGAQHRAPDPGGVRGPVSESQAEAEGERRVLVVAHGTLNRILMSVGLGTPVSDYRRRYVQDRVNLTVLRFERGDGPAGAQLVLANDVAHLRNPGETPWG